jgi:hypothetical protein
MDGPMILSANYRAGVDAGIPLLFAFGRHWPGTTHRVRST